jgi:F0F1-type ATP synthase assembly protein I
VTINPPTWWSPPGQLRAKQGTLDVLFLIVALLIGIGLGMLLVLLWQRVRKKDNNTKEE